VDHDRGAPRERLEGRAERPDPLPAETETRVASFAELIATAVANSTARSELVASRARIVAASDDARRRIQRDLHDGAQQRLVTLSLADPDHSLQDPRDWTG
jgi:signal transduction histidine kinase